MVSISRNAEMQGSQYYVLLDVREQSFRDKQFAEAIGRQGIALGRHLDEFAFSRAEHATIVATGFCKITIDFALVPNGEQSQGMGLGGRFLCPGPELID